MKSRHLISVVVLMFVYSLIIGCANMPTIPQEHKGATVGAGVGAVAGAAIGGSSPRGAIIGGLLGALIGGAVGHYGYDQRRDYQQTAQTYKDYQPTSGTRVYMEEVNVTPQSINPGGTVDLRSTYAVLTPSSDTQVPITETREITHNGSLVGNPQVNIQRSGGTFSSTIPLKLPDNAARGTYNVKTTIEASGSKDTRETTFTVN